MSGTDSEALDALRQIMDGTSIIEEDEDGNPKPVLTVEDEVRFGSSEEPPMPYFEFYIRDGAMQKRVRYGD